jgi:hypothetical protein
MRGRETPGTVVLVRAGTELASWPLVRRGRPDLALVDELARLHLAAIRVGCGIQLRQACRSLVELLHLVGLGAVVVERPQGVDPEG